jgi:hypothetical protein
MLEDLAATTWPSGEPEDVPPWAPAAIRRGPSSLGLSEIFASLLLLLSAAPTYEMLLRYRLYAGDSPINSPRPGIVYCAYCWDLFGLGKTLWEAGIEFSPGNCD